MLKLLVGNQNLSCRLRLMGEDDLSQVAEIDREAFPATIPPINYRNELNNRLAHYVVACSEERVVAEAGIKADTAGSFAGVWSWLGKWFGYAGSSPEKTPSLKQYVFGFAGLWLMADEAHIINIAVRERYRGQGMGELLLISMIALAKELKAHYLLLEVRMSNIGAQGLYAKYGFRVVGYRKGYYIDKGKREDAMVMSTEDITKGTYMEKVEQLRQAHFRKLGLDASRMVG